MSKYTLTARARLDLQRIWNRIAEKNINAADTVINDLRLAMGQLADMPGMGHRRADVKSARYRFWSVYSYIIAYRPDEQPIQVVRVLHGAQNIGKIIR